MTHVDTSTAVVAPLQQVAAVLRAANPGIIICVDSVAGLGGETLRMTDWHLDYVMTGSQKAIGVPAGLCISVARPRARRRQEPQDACALHLRVVGQVGARDAKLHG